MRRAWTLACLGLAAFALPATRDAPRAQACGAFGAYDFDTYEAEDYVTEYAQAIHLAAEGMAGLPMYSVAGEEVNLAYQGLESGPRGARTEADPALRIPPTVLKSIAWIEANWSNASGIVPFGGVGPALVSFDCGYGLGQVTTGMANTTGTASARQAAIGTHPLFNLAESARILADKWNAAPSFRPIGGTGDPAALEDWYYAIWSYNGFAFSNHPLNPNRDPLRAGAADSPIYHCYDPTAPSYQEGLFGYGDYTYQERVYGCMRHPPLREDRSLWDAQLFFMPDFDYAEVAEALAPAHFQGCEEGGFSGGCPAMDFPTTFTDDPATAVDDARTTHPDTTPASSAAWLAKWLSDPHFAYSGPTSMLLGGEGRPLSGTVRVKNTGKGIAPFRVRTSHPWIVVKHANDPFPRTLDGSVAIGAETAVVLQRKTESQSRIAQQGWESVLEISVNASKAPAGLTVGRVWLEPLLGSGGSFEVEVIALNVGGQQRVVAPALSREP